MDHRNLVLDRRDAALLVTLFRRHFDDDESRRTRQNFEAFQQRRRRRHVGRHRVERRRRFIAQRRWRNVG